MVDPQTFLGLQGLGNRLRERYGNIHIDRHTLNSSR
jgi:hypothetical protein